MDLGFVFCFFNNSIFFFNNSKYLHAWSGMLDRQWHIEPESVPEHLDTWSLQITTMSQ